MTMIDDGQPDHKIVSVLSRDPSYESLTKASHFPQHTFRMLKRFFEDYKTLEGKDVEVDEILPAEAAHSIIEDSIRRYEEAVRVGKLPTSGAAASITLR
jgi:inorganic pyrophosphatase